MLELLASSLESGLLIDLILALMVAEAAALALLARWLGRNLPLADILALLLPGALLMLAIRFALTGAGPLAVAVALLAALLAHIADVVRRFGGIGR